MQVIKLVDIIATSTSISSKLFKLSYTVLIERGKRRRFEIVLFWYRIGGVINTCHKVGYLF